MNIAEIQGAANDAYLKTLGSIDLVPSGHYKAIAAAVAAVAPLLLEEAQRAVIRVLTEPTDELFAPACDRYVVMVKGALVSLTAKPDPAVDAVVRALYGTLSCSGDRQVVAERIVAAVDAARAK